MDCVLQDQKDWCQISIIEIVNTLNFLFYKKIIFKFCFYITISLTILSFISTPNFSSVFRRFEAKTQIMMIRHKQL